MKLIRKILKGVSLTAAMFVFQACYGPMEDYYDTKVTFHVVDSDTGEPMKDVQIWSKYVNESDSTECEGTSYSETSTDVQGFATIWTDAKLQCFSFVDKDSLYTPVDTIINPIEHDTVDIVLRKLD